MKKPSSPNQTEKRAKRTPEEKTARKSAKNAGRVTSNLTDDRADKKASQKKSLKSAAKQLQKELNGRMSEVVSRIRKETKAKLKEVVKEATRRLDGDTERMFEQALHTIVRHYDSVASTPSSSENGTNASSGKAARGKGQTLNKDGSPRKPRSARASDDSAAPTEAAATPAPKTRGRKPGSTTTKKQPAATGARRGRKPTATPAASVAPAARRGPKPRAQAASAPEASDVMNSADSASTGAANE